MKTKIKLTEEQLKVLIGAKEEQLKDAFNKEVEKLKANLIKEIDSLKKKYEHFEVDLEDDTPKKKRTPIDVELLKSLATKGLTKSEIAKQMGKTYASIDQKIKKLGLKIKPKK